MGLVEAKGKIKRSKNDLLEALVLMPVHKHRDPSIARDCDNCKARNFIKEAYQRLPRDSELDSTK